MPAIKVACPSCGNGLTFGTMPAPGTMVKCPRCAKVVALNVPIAQTIPTATMTAPARLAPSPNGPVALEPLTPHPQGESGNPVLWLSLVLAGLLLLVGVGLGLTTFFTVGNWNSPPTASLASKDKDPSANPGANQPEPARSNVTTRPQPSPPPSEPLRPDPFREPFRPNPLDNATSLRPNPSVNLTTLPEAEQKKVDAAIDRGVSFLRATQTPGGGWNGSHKVGYAALPGLTLLECGVPPQDPAVQKAARFVREAIPSLTGTYELGLAILFLDRLGEPSDRSLIQTMALRLVAGQNGDGGWGYNCPILSQKDNDLLLTALQETRPRSPLELFVGPDGQRPQFIPTQRVPGIGEEFLPIIIQQQQGNNLPSNPTPAPEPKKPDPKPDVKKPDPKKPAKAKPNPTVLPPALQDIPALQNKLEFKAPRSRSDNSNTQFAALALWAARRHEVPMERTLAFLEKRFRTSQNPDGSWGYMSGNKGFGRQEGTPPMTCSGLLSLALGHGVLQELQARSAADGKPVPLPGNIEDPGLLKGLEILSRHVGDPREDGLQMEKENLYYLWSLERVCVLFNLKKIHNKDWYRWGAQMLVANQNGNGSWTNGHYHGNSPVIDTCFALLFLKRANLAKDLTDKLEFLVEVKP